MFQIHKNFLHSSLEHKSVSDLYRLYRIWVAASAFPTKAATLLPLSRPEKAVEISVTTLLPMAGSETSQI